MPSEEADLGYEQEGRQVNAYRGRWQRGRGRRWKRPLCASVFLPEIRSRAAG